MSLWRRGVVVPVLLAMLVPGGAAARPLAENPLPATEEPDPDDGSRFDDGTRFTFPFPRALKPPAELTPECREACGALYQAAQKARGELSDAQGDYSEARIRWRAAQKARSDAQTEITSLEERIRQALVGTPLRKVAAQLRAEAETLRAKLPALREAEEVALIERKEARRKYLAARNASDRADDAYQDCIERCKPKAAGLGRPVVYAAGGTLAAVGGYLMFRPGDGGGTPGATGTTGGTTPGPQVRVSCRAGVADVEAQQTTGNCAGLVPSFRVRTEVTCTPDHATARLSDANGGFPRVFVIPLDAPAFSNIPGGQVLNFQQVLSGNLDGLAFNFTESWLGPGCRNDYGIRGQLAPVPIP